MNQNYLTLLILFFTFSVVAHPGKDSVHVPDIDTTVTSKVSQQLNYLQKMAKYNAGVLEETPKKEAVSKVFKSFPDLDNALIKNKSFYKSFKDMSPEFDTAYLEENFPKNPKVDTLINQAINAFEKVKELKNFVDIITGNELLELPVGLGGKIDSTSGNGVELVITEVKFHPEYAEFNAWAKLTIPQKEKELYFGEKGSLIRNLNKANAYLGSYNPVNIPSAARELGTKDILDRYNIYKNYLFSDNNQELLAPGSVLMLNVPNEIYNPDTFFDNFNKEFLDYLIKNKDKVEIIFTTKPEYQDLFKAWNSKIGDYDYNIETKLYMPSGYAKEIKYLRDRGIKTVKFKDGSIINLDEVDLSKMDWKTKWNY